MSSQNSKDPSSKSSTSTVDPVAVTAGVGAAAAVVMLIPPIIVFIISQSNVIETMSYSGIK